ncbi:General secretion pathway protein N [plant metagenome]
MRRLLMPLAALLVALCAALAVLPARWMMAWVPETLPFALVDASGSLWRGQALVAVGPPGQRRTLPDPLQWRWTLASGWQPAMAVTHPWLAGPLQLRPTVSGMAVSAQTLRLPATTLMAAGAPLNSLSPGGELRASWPAQVLRARPAAGPLLTLDWLDASSARVRIQPLGSYRAQVSAQEDGAIALKINTLNGPLRVEAEGALTRGRLSRFAGTAQAAPDSDPATREALAPLLGLVGPSRNGVTQLRLH